MQKLYRHFTLILAILFVFTFVAVAQPTVTGKVQGNIAEINTEKGDWKFILYPGKIIKANFTPLASMHNEQVSDAVILKAGQTIPKILASPRMVSVSWPGNISVEVSGDKLQFQLGGSKKIELENSFYSPLKRGFTFSLEPSEMIFGAGERSIPLNRRGYALPLNNAPSYGYGLNATALNYSVPFILSSKLYAIFFDNPSIGLLDIGKTDPEILTYEASSGELSFYIIPGDDYSSILKSFSNLVGTQPLPPRWAMGNLMSRFGYRGEQETRSIIHKMQQDSIPLDAVIFDLFWFGDSIKQTMGNLEWINKKAWPDPRKMIADFDRENIKTILITEPFVLNTSGNYRASKKFHATDSAGNPYLLKNFYFGNGGIIDLFRKDAQRWFFDKYKQQINIGVAGWWGDLGEPETHPADVYHNLQDLGFKRKFAANEVHNIFGHYWSKTIYDNYKKYYPGKRLFHLNRSGYAGSPRYASFPWSGDVSRSWDGLKGQVSLLQGMSISGVPFIHSDAGGFAGGEGDPELYVRWLQFAAFTPIFRPHGADLGDLDPNSKDIPSEAALWPEPTRSLARTAINTRYNWLPYNYNLAYLQTTAGMPLISPLFFENKNDSNLYKATDQYFWGQSVMVVPITEKGQQRKSYYIPGGSWTNFNTLEKINGPAWVTDSSLSEASIPVFIQEGSFIPQLPKLKNTTEYFDKTLSVLYFPSQQPSEYTLYEDDGANANAIREGRYELTRFKTTGVNKRSLSIRINSPAKSKLHFNKARKIELILEQIEYEPHAIVVNGLKLSIPGAWDRASKRLTIPLSYNHRSSTILVQFKKP